MYKNLLAEADPDPVLYTYAAACLYYMGSYDDAMAMAAQASQTLLSNTGKSQHTHSNNTSSTACIATVSRFSMQ